MSAEDTLNKLRGFLEINGDGLPTQEQWQKILDLVKEKPNITLPPRPTIDPNIFGPKPYEPFKTDPWNPWKPGDIICGTGNGPEATFSVSTKYNDMDIPQGDVREYWEFDEEGNITLVGAGILNNSFEVEDVMNMAPITMTEVDSKILETDSIEFEFQPGDEATNDRTDTPG